MHLEEGHQEEDRAQHQRGEDGERQEAQQQGRAALIPRIIRDFVIRFRSRLAGSARQVDFLT